MNIKRLQAFAFVAVITACPLLLSSCAVQERGRQNGTQEQTTPMGQDLGFRGQNLMGGNQGGNQQGATQDNNTGNTQGITGNGTSQDGQRAQRIKAELEKLSELGEVNVVVSGNTALVGYKPVGQANADELKKDIIERVKQTDPNISTCAASEDADVVSRIQKMSEDIVKQRPAGDISNEVQQLLNRINPMVR